MADASGIKAGRAYVEMGVNDGQFKAGLDRVGAGLKAYGATVAGIGAKMTAIGSAGLAGFSAAVNQFTEVGAELQRMSVRTGVSVEALSAFGYAMEQSGSNLQGFESAVQSLQGKLLAAATGSKEAQDSFLLLGLSWRQVASLDAGRQVELLAEQISRISHPARRAQAALQLFGSTDVLPMLAGGAQGVRALTGEAERLGLVMSGESAQSAVQMSQSMNQLKRSLQAIAMAIGEAVLPDLLSATKAMLPLVKSTIDWVKENKPLVAGVLLGVKAFAALGLGLVAVGGAMGTVGFAISGLVTAVGLVGSFVGALAPALPVLALIAVAVVGIAGQVYLAVRAFDALTGAVGPIWDSVKRHAQGAFDSIRGTATTAARGIGDALRAGRFDLAFKIASTAIQLEWAKVTGYLESKMFALQEVWVRVTSFLFGDWEGFTQAVSVKWEATLSGFSAMWEATVASLRGAWESFGQWFNAIVTGLSAAWESMVGVISRVVGPMKAALAPILDFFNSKVGRAVLQKVGLVAAPGLAIAAAGANNLAEGRGLFGMGDAAGNAAQRERRLGDVDAARRAQAEDLAARRRALEDELRGGVEAAAEARRRAGLRPEVGAAARQVPGGLGAGSMKADVVGGFNAFGFAGAGGRTVMDRVAQGIADLNQNARDILEEVRNPRPDPPIIVGGD